MKRKRVSAKMSDLDIFAQLASEQERERNDVRKQRSRLRRKFSRRKVSAEYNEYLKSDKWKEIRWRIIRRDNFKCRVCSSTAELQVHHITYPKTLGDENDIDLLTLCRSCHRKFHRRKF